jgi:hypothetical protein
MEKTFDEIDKDMYTIIKVDDIDNYKCVLCDFYTVYKNSLMRHFNKKNLCYKSKEFKCLTCNKIFDKKQHLDNHLNKKNKCNINIENEKKTYSENSNDFEKDKILLENDILKKDLIHLKNENERLKKFIEEKDIDDVQKYKDFYHSMANDIIEIMESKKSPMALRKGIYLNKIEYIILHGSLTRYQYNEINNENRENIKRKVFALMEIISDSFLNQFMDDVKNNYKDLIPFIREFQDYLKTLDNKKKINGMNPLSYYDIINIKLGI